MVVSGYLKNSLAVEGRKTQRAPVQVLLRSSTHIKRRAQIEAVRKWKSVYLRTYIGQRAASAAEEAGFRGFVPDACLINRYEPGARLSLHQDKNERDFEQPIVSVSLGLPAVFLYGGKKRADKTIRVPVAHGDVVVWGGPARLRYHGVMPLKEGFHPLVGEYRFNLTLRRTG